MSEQKISRREKRQKAKRQKQMQSIGIMIIGLLIIISGVVLISLTGSKDIELTYINVNRNAIGDPDAPVVMEEYFNFGCSHCANFAETTFPLLLEDYINTGLIYYISNPITFGDPNDAFGIASQAAYCAADQGKFFEMHDAIFSKFSAYGYTAGQLEAMAKKVDLDLGEYNSCMANGDQISTLQTVLESSIEAGVNSTPNFLINGELAIVGNREYSFFQEQIDLAIAAQSGE